MEEAFEPEVSIVFVVDRLPARVCLVIPIPMVVAIVIYSEVD